jgi:hypothetical protein
MHRHLEGTSSQLPVQKDTGISLQSTRRPAQAVGGTQRSPAASGGSAPPLNRLQRELLASFADAGGDLGDGAACRRLFGWVEVRLPLLPDQAHRAMELVWGADTATPYRHLAWQLNVSEPAFRQLVSRGKCWFRKAIQRQTWEG